MKLVMIYTCTDECTFSFEIAYPFEYESVEKAEFDFELLWEKAESDFYFGNKRFYCSDFGRDEYYGPRFMTIEEWFARERIL